MLDWIDIGGHDNPHARIDAIRRGAGFSCITRYQHSGI